MGPLTAALKRACRCQHGRAGSVATLNMLQVETLSRSSIEIDPDVGWPLARPLNIVPSISSFVLKMLNNETLAIEVGGQWRELI